MKQGKKFDSEPTNSDETLKRNFQIKTNKLSCCMDYVKVSNILKSSTVAATGFGKRSTKNVNLERNFMKANKINVIYVI